MLNRLLQSCLKLCVGVAIVLGLVGMPPTWAAPTAAETNPVELTKAIQAIEDLDHLRSGLASTLEGQTEPPTMETMKEVCRPVGMQAQQLSQENGWQVKQISDKYRNPDHAPDGSDARKALVAFKKNPDLMGFWDRETIGGQPGTRYYRRINVEASCLACHGQKNQRPQFVQDKYPQDRAYDFEVGDLRGMYSVFMPDVQAALQAALQAGVE